MGDFEMLHPRGAAGRFAVKELDEAAELGLDWLEIDTGDAFGFGEIDPRLDASDPAARLAALIPAARLLGEAYAVPSRATWPEHDDAPIADAMGLPLSDREHAVRHLGAAVTARAAQIAGITPEQVGDSWKSRVQQAESHSAQVEVILDSYSPRIDPLVEQAHAQQLGSPEWNITHDQIKVLQAAREAEIDALGNSMSDRDLRLLKEGRDEQTLTELSALAEGYRCALAEIRSMGGDMEFTANTRKTTAAVFAVAQEVYPTSWTQAGQSAGPVYARTLKQRAHYSAQTAFTRFETRPDVAVEWMYDHEAQHYSAFLDRDVEPTGETEDDRAAYRIAYYDTAFDEYTGEPLDMSGRRGWTQATKTNRSGTPVTYWRKPTTYRVKARKVVAEIRTNDTPTLIPGKPDGYGTAVHESAHRYEHTVPGLSRMQAEFLDRRWRQQAGIDAESDLPVPQRLYPAARGNTEVAIDGGFAAAYMGKTYNAADHGVSRHHEVLSCGTEALFAGRYGALVGVGGYEPDPDMRDFILGALACGGSSA